MLRYDSGEGCGSLPCAMRHKHILRYPGGVKCLSGSLALSYFCALA
jgi:hypothetical protein